MNKKEVRKALLVIVIMHLSIQFLLENLDAFSTVCMTLFYQIMVLCIVVIVCFKVILKVIYYNQYKIFKEYYDYLKTIHNKRYKLYFSSNNKEEIDVYTQEIQNFGEIVLNAGNYYINNKTFSKRKMQEVQEIINKTKELMKKESVIY